MQDKIFSIIKRPVISEKSTALAEVANRYVFEVDAKASKSEIKNAIEQLFKVKVKAVNTSMMQGKNKRAGRFEFKRANWKKAVITLTQGQKIELFQVKA